MSQMIPAIVMGFREGLEAFLVIALILRYLNKINQGGLKVKAYQGLIAGVILSALLGLGLNALSGALGGAGKVAKVWESVASAVALGLVTMFIVWMIPGFSPRALTVN